MNLSFPGKKIRAVFTDLDGTLTNYGEILPSTFQALHDLKAAGYWTVLVTGRPAGWTDCLMTLWPLDAAIFENGAGFYLRGDKQIELVKLAEKDNPPSARAKLKLLFEKIRREIPHAKLAADQDFRLYDFAINHSEEKPYLSASEIERALEILREDPGVIAKSSSTHINYLYGDHTKRTGIEALIEYDGKRRGITASEIVFIGDSLNDEPVFAYLDHTVGVANISTVWDRLSSRPKQVTKNQGGKGFEELAYCLLTP